MNKNLINTLSGHKIPRNFKVTYSHTYVLIDTLYVVVKWIRSVFELPPEIQVDLSFHLV